MQPLNSIPLKMVEVKVLNRRTYLKNIPWKNYELKYVETQRNPQVYSRKSAKEIQLNINKILKYCLLALSYVRQIFISKGVSLMVCSPCICLTDLSVFSPNSYITVYKQRDRNQQNVPRVCVCSFALQLQSAVNIAEHKHLTIKVTFKYHCCSQVDIWEWW